MDSSSRKNEGAHLKDTRFDLTIDPELQQKAQEVIEAARELAQDRPLASAKFCYDIQGSLHTVEKEAAFRANGRFKVSWAKIAGVFNRGPHWAWDRYVASGLSHPRSRRRSAE